MQNLTSPDIPLPACSNSFAGCEENERLSREQMPSDIVHFDRHEAGPRGTSTARFQMRRFAPVFGAVRPIVLWRRRRCGTLLAGTRVMGDRGGRPVGTAIS
jgi:hypothetical protein